MKKKVIKALVVLLAVSLVTMGFLPGEIAPGAYSNSDVSSESPPSLEENLKLLEEGMDIPMTVEPSAVVMNWSTEAHLIYSKATVAVLTTKFFAGVYTYNYFKGASTSILVTSPVVYYNHWTSAWVGCFNGNVWLQTGWVKEAGVGAKPRVFVQMNNWGYIQTWFFDQYPLTIGSYYAFRVFYTGTPYIWRAQIYYNGNWITLKDVYISNVSSIGPCSFAECYAADGTVEAGQLPRGMNIYGSIYNGSSWNTWTSAYSTVLKVIPPLNCLVRNPYYNIEYWGP
jgi:hypothetical protein